MPPISGKFWGMFAGMFVSELARYGIVIDDANVFNDKLQEWEDFYNFHHPHGVLGGLDGQTSYERLRKKTTGT